MTGKTGFLFSDYNINLPGILQRWQREQTPLLE